MSFHVESSEDTPAPRSTTVSGPGSIRRSPTRALARFAITTALVVYSALLVAVVAAFTVSTISDPADPGPGASRSRASAVGGSHAARSPDSDPARSFVVRSGRSMLLAGATFKFVGFNLYNAAASRLYSCPSAVRLDDSELDAALSQVRDAGGTVVRFWAFQAYTRGSADYRGVDRVLAAARAHGLKVLPVLENQWSNCSRPRGAPLSEVENGTWFRAGYRAPLPGQPLSYRTYVRRITHHYRDNSTIFAWSLTNEAETNQIDSDGRSELVGFARDMSAVVHEADQHHLVTLGTQSNGAPGASGADFSDVYGLPGLDFAEVHDWANRGSDDQAMPGASNGSLPAADQCQSTTAPLACSFSLAKDLDKPVVVAEAGIAADDRASRVARSRQLAAKLDAAFRAGAAGYLIWQLNLTNTDRYGVIIGSDDPMFSMLRVVGQRWALDS